MYQSWTHPLAVAPPGCVWVILHKECYQTGADQSHDIITSPSSPPCPPPSYLIVTLICSLNLSGGSSRGPNPLSSFKPLYWDIWLTLKICTCVMYTIAWIWQQMNIQEAITTTKAIDISLGLSKLFPLHYYLWFEDSENTYYKFYSINEFLSLQCNAVNDRHYPLQ